MFKKNQVGFFILKSILVFLISKKMYCKFPYLKKEYITCFLF